MQDDRRFQKQAEAASVMARVFRGSPRQPTRRLRLGIGGAVVLLAVLLAVLAVAVFGRARRQFVIDPVQPWETMPAWNDATLVESTR